jgi:hypothetical protein
MEATRQAKVSAASSSCDSSLLALTKRFAELHGGQVSEFQLPDMANAVADSLQATWLTLMCAPRWCLMATTIAVGFRL